MKRSEFLHCLGALVGVACAREAPAPLAPPPPPSAPPPQPIPAAVPRHYQHSAWLGADTSLSDDEWRRRLSYYREAGISSVLLQVFDGEQAYYASQHLPVKVDLLGRLLPLAQEVGLELHAWFWTLPCSVPAVMGSHPEWYMVNRLGDATVNKAPYLPSYKFLCPTRPEVREFLKRRLVELSGYPLAGVHLDYVRFPDRILPIGLQEQYGVTSEQPLPEYDFCYCDVCRQRFSEASGIDPKNFNQPDEQAAWSDFRERQLTELVNDVVSPITTAKKIALSAAVYPNWQDVMQKWEDWKLDVAVPLLYHNLYQEPITWIGFQSEEAVGRLHEGATCQPGLLVSQLSPQDLVGAFRMALEGGASGVSFFTAEAMGEEHWKLFARAQEEAEEKFLSGG